MWVDVAKETCYARNVQQRSVRVRTEQERTCQVRRKGCCKGSDLK